jgi:hypothetical protein
MMSTLRSLNAPGLLYLEAPPLAASLIVAEQFFKFHSFTLEALAFLGLWYVLGGVYMQALSLISRRTGRVPHPSMFRR